MSAVKHPPTLWPRIPLKRNENNLPTESLDEMPVVDLFMTVKSWEQLRLDGQGTEPGSHAAHRLGTGLLPGDTVRPQTQVVVAGLEPVTRCPAMLEEHSHPHATWEAAPFFFTRTGQGGLPLLGGPFPACRWVRAAQRALWPRRLRYPARSPGLVFSPRPAEGVAARFAEPRSRAEPLP